jgi:hypothetical protein
VMQGTQCARFNLLFRRLSFLNCSKNENKMCSLESMKSTI